mmetsp:Transcript_13513/g.41018  ORF Transcript_13513/g.41018 Transcript_13513/m.41018 type:complete len:272 (+) Transcript_13513:570-1385(+)
MRHPTGSGGYTSTAGGDAMIPAGDGRRLAPQKDFQTRANDTGYHLTCCALRLSVRPPGRPPGGTVNDASRFEERSSSMIAAMAPSQSASSGRIEKGSSIWMPISSMPSRKKAMTSVTGTVPQWFHELPITGQMPKGRKTRKVARKREVWRVYTSGTGDLKMRSQAPVKSTSTEMDVSMRARSIGSMLAWRSTADMALSMNIGRLFAAMHASTCSSDIRPMLTICISSLRKTASSVGPRRKLRSALAKAAVLAASTSLTYSSRISFEKKTLA